MHKKIIILFISIHLLFLFSAFADPEVQTNDDAVCSEQIEPLRTRKFGSYKVIISYAADRMCQRLEIFQRGLLVFREVGIDNHYSFGSDDRGHFTLSRLTGSGLQLAIRRWTGGAHCCTSLLIFDLNKNFKKVAEIDGGNFEPEIVKLNGEVTPEIHVTDDFLAYRFSNFASSAVATVVLKYQNGRFAVVPELMKTPTPPKPLQTKKVTAWRKLLLQDETPDWPPPGVIQDLTELVFTGHRTLALKLLNQAWPEKKSGKSEFLKSYEEALQESDYYTEFENLLPKQTK